MSKSATKVVPILTENLGLTKAEATVLLPVIHGGNMTAGGVSLVSGEELKKTESTLERLVKKGFVLKIDGIVPVYRAVPPLTATSDTLASMIEKINTLTEETHKAIQLTTQEAEKAIEDLLKSQRTRDETLNDELEQLESDFSETIREKTEEVTELTNTALTGYTQTVEDALASLDTLLDDDLGSKLMELQEELDSSQKELSKDIKKIAREFDKWFTKEKKDVSRSIAQISNKAKTLHDSKSSAISNSFVTIESKFDGCAESISTTMNEEALGACNTISEVVNNITEDLKIRSTQLEKDLSQAFVSSRSNLEQIIKDARSANQAQSEQAKKKIESAVNIAQAFSGSIESWSTEVTEFVQASAKSVDSQLDQVSSTQNAFIDVVRNSIDSHLEKTNTNLSEQYSALRTIARSMSSDTESFLLEARSAVTNLLQERIVTDQERMEAINDSLMKSINKWGEKAAKSIDKKVGLAMDEITSVLDTEVGEFNTLTENMRSRLNSSFASVKSNMQTKNDASLLSIKKFVQDYESQMESKLAEVIKNYIDVSQQQVKESKELYESLNNRLNERLSESVSSLSSYISRVQKEIDGAIDDQMKRVDTRAQEMREDFHVHVEDITRQFMTFTEGLEATFNGMISSQTVEARDLITSAHSDFKNALRAESEQLNSDSLKIQQEYASEIGLKIDSIVESSASLKRVLEEFSVEKKSEISKTTDETLEGIEEALNATISALTDLESGTLKQIGENLTQVSKEFEGSVQASRDTVSERLSSIRDEAESILSKSASGVKSTVETYASEESESKQRLAAETSKQLDALAAKTVKKAQKQVEVHQEQLAESEVEMVEVRTGTRDEVMSAIETRKAEADVALEAANVWIESAAENIETSLESYGSKLDNEVLVMQQGLTKAAEDAASSIQESGSTRVNRFEEISNAFLKKVEGAIRSQSTSFIEGSEASLNKSLDAMSEMPDTLSTKVSKILHDVITVTKLEASELSSEIEREIDGFQAGAKTLSDEFSTLLDKTSEQFSRSYSDTIEQTQQSAVLSNQHATRKFESIGLDLKASLSSSSYELAENLRSDSAEKSAEIIESSNKSLNAISERLSATRTSRTDLINSVAQEREKELKGWSTKLRGKTSEVRKKIDSILEQASDTTCGTLEMIKAINEVSEDLLSSVSSDTWYLSGNEEGCAHIMDMAQRAEKSVILSVLNLECLDLKKLSKLKKPIRKVLVIPHTEERNPSLDTLTDWRIWETHSPQMFALIDDSEILIGGQEEAQESLFLISRNDSYLKLYHDVIGPQLIENRVA